LIDKKKIAGILLESTSKSNKINKIVIGVGINVNQPNFPGKFDIPPTSIRKEFHSLVSREKLLSEVLNNLEQNFETAKEQCDKIMSDWRTRCKMIGEKVKIIEDEKTKFGIFEDIDEEGFLILKQGELREKIHYGDVILR
jgi:BirA family biotin operon repressor/biotin-[acetyl-CoA-carboxylase] ligase